MPVAFDYHDSFWYPTIGQARTREFMRTEWGALFERYGLVP
jgi:hypothetical protein